MLVDLNGKVPSTRSIANKALSADISSEELRTGLGFTQSAITPPKYPGIGNLGDVVRWANQFWRVVHRMTGMVIMAYEFPSGTTQWSTVTDSKCQEYFGSKLYQECMNFSNSLNLFACDYIIPLDGLPLVRTPCNLQRSY